MSLPLMPKATAVWLVENTTLTFDQIAAFCGLHVLEIQAIADGDVAMGIVGKSPVMQGIVTAEDIAACEADENRKLTFVQNDMPDVQRRAKGPRYTAITKRAEKPDGIAYLIKNYPDIPDAQIIKLLGTTKNTIDSIRKRTNPNIANIKPTDPVQLGLCSRSDLDALIRKVEAAKEKAAQKAERSARKKSRGDAARDDVREADAEDTDDADSDSADIDVAESTGVDNTDDSAAA